MQLRDNAPKRRDGDIQVHSCQRVPFGLVALFSDFMTVSARSNQHDSCTRFRIQAVVALSGGWQGLMQPQRRLQRTIKCELSVLANGHLQVPCAVECLAWWCDPLSFVAV